MNIITNVTLVGIHPLSAQRFYEWDGRELKYYDIVSESEKRFIIVPLNGGRRSFINKGELDSTYSYDDSYKTLDPDKLMLFVYSKLHKKDAELRIFNEAVEDTKRLLNKIVTE